MEEIKIKENSLNSSITKTFNSYNLEIRCKTKRQALKCFNLMFLNMGYLGKLSISSYQKSVTIESLPFKHMANKLIRLIEIKKLRFEEIILTEYVKNKKIDVIKK